MARATANASGRAVVAVVTVRTLSGKLELGDATGLSPGQMVSRFRSSPGGLPSDDVEDRP